MMSEIQPPCFGLLLAQDRPVTSVRLWNNKTEVGRTFLSNFHVSWDPVTLEVHGTMCVTSNRRPLQVQEAGLGLAWRA